MALANRLGVRYLAQHVPQDYGVGDLALAFVGGLVVCTCVHAALLAWHRGAMSLRTGAATWRC
ncbi:MAG: hypothetical protein JJD92_12170 [Frankiaceae bacterium]|nr:hypothetical protein [Frankiaceae bacterium]